MITVKEFGKKLLNEKSVAIFMHMRPDGDTIGSSLALKLALNSKGIVADVFCSDNMPTRFVFLKEISLVKNMVNPKDYSAFVAVDCASESRMGELGDVFLSHKNTYVIDHHISNTRFAKVNCVIDNASNCENVYDLITELGIEIDVRIANLLAIGVVTDTGNFAHKNVTPKTLLTASKLVELGADLNEIIYNTFKSKTKECALLVGKVMSKIRYFLDDRYAVAVITKKDLEDAGATNEDTEGIIDSVLAIKCVEVASSVLELTENKYKVSFRSKEADVNAVAGLFGGGGHILASGCQINNCSLEEVLDKLTFAVSKYLPEK